MKRQFTVLALLLSLIAFSCDNDDKPTPNLTDGTYISSHTEKSNTRLFTKEGEIIDQQIINNFINNRAKDSMKSDWGDSYINVGTNLYSILNLDGPQYIRLEFKKNDTVITEIDEFTETRILNKKGKYLYLESRFLENKYRPINVVGIQHYDPLDERNIGKLKQDYDSVGNYKHRYFLKEENGKLIMPQLVVSSFKAKKSSETGKIDGFEKSTYWNINNEYNPNSYEELKDNDTLLIQEQKLIFKKE